MHFGKTLEQSVYPPWREYYIDYSKLKLLLREHEDDWSERDVSLFVEELINVQLEKVNNFQRKMHKELRERTSACESRLQRLVEKDGDISGGELKKESEELDNITRDINELERFSRINFTGFLKAAKKHDRRSSMVAAKGGEKGKIARSNPKVRPLLQVRQAQLEFNKEDYSPLLYRLSTMYDFVRQQIPSKDETQDSEQTSRDTSRGPSAHTGYTSHKFWVHPDNVLEVKTFILRHLPVLVYNAKPSKEIDDANRDPEITSIYFDNPDFSIYNDKVLKSKNVSSLRLRWYGQLLESPELLLERKTIRSNDDTAGASEERISLKQKYVNDFINGRYSMEKTVDKMRQRKGVDDAEVEKYDSLVKSLQEFISENNLQPVLRASYTRTAFQIPGDDRLRVSLDTDLALIREDVLDPDRPCRDPEDWHRRDIDDARMVHPFSALRKGEISRFPHALLEIKIRDQHLRPRSKRWVHELETSHLVHPAPRFSKFVHGVATLFDDHVNNFPFWLSELEEDIRRDPKEAWNTEQERIKKRKEDELAVGSFRNSLRNFGGRGSPQPEPIAPNRQPPPEEQDTKFPKIAPQGPGADANAKILAGTVEDTAEEETPVRQRVDGSSLDQLRQIFPSFSRYGRAHRPEVQLPPGVQKPKQLLMHAGPIKVEAKVWLANQRTFIKWMHITVLLASLSLALFNAAYEHNKLAKGIALVYTGVAVFAGLWGWGVYMWRSELIRQRSGRDFDNVFGPLFVCLALAVGLILNFTLKYLEIVTKISNGGHDGTAAEATAQAPQSPLPQVLFDQTV